MDTTLEAAAEMDPQLRDGYEDADDTLLRALLEIAESAERNRGHADSRPRDDQPVGGGA